MAAPETTPKAPILNIPGSDSGFAGPVDSPATPSSQNAWARFEFEIGKGNEGTKILMVEWNPAGDVEVGEPAQHHSQEHGGWEVSWEGKRTMVSLSEKVGNATQRVYFLIPTELTIPPVITISQPSTGRTLTTKPLPAIFAPGLGVDTKDAGKRGVLHTIWAKKRLSQLQEEIHQEMQNNSEGVSLEMAVQERQWIIEHFGLEDPNAMGHPPVPPTPQSPRSPVGGRLGEKLRGLRLATSPSDLANSGGQKNHHLYSLSPDTSDIAVPSGSAFSSAASQAAPGGVASLNAIIEGGQPGAGGAPASKQSEADELFALPMSPRSPEMKKSPFSFL